MFLLVVTNGYSVEHTPYQTRDEAKAQMEIAWKALAKDLQSDEWKEMSSLGEEQAILYYNGEHVFVWDVIEVKEKPYYVAVHYSFDTEVPLKNFETCEEAIRYVKEDSEREWKIQTEEDGKIPGEDLFLETNEDGSWARMKILRGDPAGETDVIEWTVTPL